MCLLSTRLFQTFGLPRAHFSFPRVLRLACLPASFFSALSTPPGFLRESKAFLPLRLSSLSASALPALPLPDRLSPSFRSRRLTAPALGLAPSLQLSLSLRLHARPYAFPASLASRSASPAFGLLALSFGLSLVLTQDTAFPGSSASASPLAFRLRFGLRFLSGALRTLKTPYGSSRQDFLWSRLKAGQPGLLSRLLSSLPLRGSPASVPPGVSPLLTQLPFRHPL